MTTAARQLLLARVDVFNPGNVSRGTSAIEVDGVELRIQPFLLLAWSSAALLQVSGYFRFRFQFPCVQALPAPDPFNDRIAVSSPVRSMHALTVVNELVVVAMTLGARLQCRVLAIEILTSMFGMAGGTGDTCVTMGGNNRGSKTLRLMAAAAFRVHFFSVRRTYATNMTRIAAATVLHGNCGLLRETCARVRGGDWPGRKSLFVLEGSHG